MLAPIGYSLRSICLRYERLPLIRFYCACLGHEERHCNVRIDDCLKGEIKDNVVSHLIPANPMPRSHDLEAE